jgi:two-component system nitrate/nitrite response regulator NarL
MTCVSIVIAGGCPVFLWGLISILGPEHDFDVVASCRNGIESLQAIQNLSPDTALLDSSMPRVSGVNVLASAISEGSHTRIVLLAAPEELPCEKLSPSPGGAYGIVPTNMRPEVLVHSLRQVAECTKTATSGSKSMTQL